jgi:N-acetylgalactosamine-N,N'-diacetylbacillosaminyl-diphospho-undecaprenol 4-alpha-N-acetylgalactosaminyltransferase
VEGEVLLKLSILIYSLGNGGAERIVSILLKELSYKYEIELILMNDTIFYEIPKNVKIIFLEKSNPKEKGFSKLLKLPILGWKYKKLIKNSDVSLSFMNRPNYINIFAKLFGSKIKTIISERAMPSLQHKSILQGKINKLLIKILYKKADVVIANSKGNSFDLIKNFNIKSVRTIYNPINIINCNKTNNNKFIFVTIGRLDKGKNHKLLIEAFNELDINAELWIIGDGYLKDELQQIANDNVKFLGTQKDVYQFLAKANCFVFSSNYEGFPNVLLEALNCKLPIISTDCKSGPREILAPDTDFKTQTQNVEIVEYGILTKVGDIECMKKAMMLIYENEELRYNFEIKAKNRLEEFRVENIINKWEKIINE